MAHRTMLPAVPTTRPPLERMMVIHQWLRDGSFPNSNRLAKHFEVSGKTIQRDIEFMRDRMTLPIEYDQTRYGYFYTKPVDTFPTVHVTEGELISLFVAKKALEQYKGTDLEKTLRNAFEKICSGMESHVTFNWTDMETSISFNTIGKAEINPMVFQVLSKAVMSRYQVDFEYRKLERKRYERRLAQPYHIACIDNLWYVFAYDNKREAMRTFNLARMRNVKKTKIRFLKKDFILADYLKNSFGVFTGGKVWQVRIWFDSWAAQLIKEKHWHPSQFITELNKGEIELRLTISDLREISRWILSWGSHAKVLEPKDLVKIVKTEAEGIRDRY